MEPDRESLERPAAPILARAALLIALLLSVGCRHALEPAPLEQVIDELDRRGHEAYNRGQYSQAAKAWQKSLELSRKGGQDSIEARVLVRISQANIGMGQYDAALTAAEQALEILENESDRLLLCEALIQKGLAYRRMALYADSRPCFDRALGIARDLKNPHLESESLRNIASLLQDQGRLDEALALFNEAIALARAHGDETSEARSLNNLGLLFDSKAEYPEALARHRESLSLRRKLGDRAGEAKVLGNICITYSKLNQIDPALQHCKSALKIAREIGDLQREANNLNNIGSLYRSRNQPRKALRYYKRSMKIKRQLSDAAGQARALNNIGEIYLHLGKLDAAETYLEQSLKLKETIRDLPGQSASYQNMAQLKMRRGKYREAKSCYLKALVFNSLADRPELVWRAYDGLSYVYEYLSLPELAILSGKRALQTIQQTRADLAGLEKNLRLSYLADKERVYKHVADLLIRQGRLPEAQQVISLLKEEEYLHYLDTRGPDDSSAYDVATTKEEGDSIEFIASVEGELGRLGYEMEVLEAESRKRNLSEEEEERLSRLITKIDAIQESFSDYLEKLESVYAEKGGIAAIEFGKKDLEDLQSMQGALEEYQLRTAIVTFLVLSERVSIILTAPRIQFHRESPVAETELNRLVFDLKRNLVNPGQDPKPHAKALYEILISPIRKEMAELHLETLMISLDGTLRYLPFAALYDGERYLAEQYNLVLFTPAAKTLYREKTLEEIRIAGLGTSEEIEDFKKLPAVEEELDVIVKEDDEKDVRGVLPGKILLNREFSADGLATMLRSGYPFVHLASHFSLRPGTVEDSFILLGDGSRLTLSELKSSRYPFQSTKLLTLSACDTAIGGEDANGREIESFAALAQKRGAEAILATLWPVADASTGTFMQLFYQLQKGHELSKAESLREVQRMFISGARNARTSELERRGVQIAGGEDAGLTTNDRSYSHPFYWAPFVLMGNYL